MAGGLVVGLLRNWLAQGEWGRAIWLLLLLAFNLNDPSLRLIRGVSEVRFSRDYYADFDRRLREAGVFPPALVFIRQDPDDRHRDLVTNSPSLDDPILRAREGSRPQMLELATFHPDRQLWFYDAKSNMLTKFEVKDFIAN